jgi:hypothetical protein
VYQKNIYLDSRKKKNAKDEPDLSKEFQHYTKQVNEYLDHYLEQGQKHNGS